MNEVKDVVTTDGGSATWDSVLGFALKVPGCTVDRYSYLVDAFSAYGKTKELETKSPLDIYPLEIVDKVAKDAISSRTMKASLLSAVAGAPGGFAMLGAIPADLAQYYYHAIVLAQELAYIYGFRSLDKGSGLNEAARNHITIMIGTMLGVQKAANMIRVLSQRAAEQAAKDIARRALTKGTIYPIVKTIARHIGIKMTKDTFARGASKTIPILGAVTSGGLTYATLRAMGKKLRTELKSTASLRRGASVEYVEFEEL